MENNGHLEPFMLMPAKKGTCPICAVNHEEGMPHDKQSLFYQYNFYNEHGRWPTWKDAMAHCIPEIQEMWIKALKERGADVER